jgi:branched-chain amino acid transport system permease protein
MSDVRVRSRLGAVSASWWRVVAGVVGGALILVWAGGDGYRASLIVVGCMYALVALGMYVPFVLAGTLSMAYSAYAAIGGYSVGLVVANLGLPYPLAWIIGPIVSAALAVVLGWTTRRLSGFFLVAVTLLFANAFQSWVQTNPLLGREAGIGGIPAMSVLGWEPTKVQFSVIAIALLLVITLLVERLRMSPWGTVVQAIREVPHAVEASGARVPRMQLVALAIGAAIGSMAGSLFIGSVQSINPLTFTLTLVFIALFIPIVGGVSTAWGCLLGAVVITHLTLNVNALGTSGMLIVALGVLVILLVAPGGLTGLGGSVWRLIKRQAGRIGSRDRS